MRSVKVASMKLPEDTYSGSKYNHDFYRALVENDDNSLRNIIQNDFTNNARDLVNQRIDYPDIVTTCSKTRKMLQMTTFHLPICIAASGGCLKAVKVLVEERCDLLITDTNGSNVIHALIWGSVLNQNGPFIDILEYLFNELDITSKRKLLFMEDDHGFRPLELACLCQQFALVHWLLSVDQVTRFERGNHGLHSHVLYDVTDYEGKAKRNTFFHPLMILTEMGHLSLFSDPESKKLLDSNVIQQWMSCKFKSLRWMIAFWSFFGMLFHIAIFLIFPCQFSEDNSPDSMGIHSILFNNRSCNYFYSPVLHQILTWYLIINSTLCILMQLVFFVVFITKYRKIFQNIRKVCSVSNSIRSKGVLLVTTHDHTFMYLILYMLIFYCFFNVSHNAEVTRFIYALLYLLNMGSMMFFFQIFPIISAYAIIFRRLIHDVGAFMIFYLFIFGFLSKLFHSILSLDPIDGVFDSPLKSLYDSFLLTVNLLDASAFPQKSVFVLPFLHMFFVMVTAYILMNFMISLLSHTVGIAMQNITHLVMLYRIRIFLFVESMGDIFPGLLLSRKLRFFLHKDDRIYIAAYELKTI